MAKRALITGVSGQDGTYLARFLLDQGYRVVGTTRSHQSELTNDIVDLRSDRLEVVVTDFSRLAAFEHLLQTYRPDEIYNCAARASSSQLRIDPAETGEVNGLAVARMLDAIHQIAPDTKFCQASSSEVFGNALESPQNEATPFRPRNAYGAAKLYAQHIVEIYRADFGCFACSAILFNHESPLRGMEFVTRKIAMGAAKASIGLPAEVRLGDLDSRRDWGFAGDYVRAMWLALQQSEPADYVIASSETHSVRELCETAFSHVGLDYRHHISVDPSYVRPREAVQLMGDATKALDCLGWRPAVSFRQLVETMVDADIARLRRTST